MKIKTLTQTIIYLLVIAAFSLNVVQAQQAGSLDSTFGSGGKVTTNARGDIDTASAVALQPNGAIVVAGRLDGSTWGAARYNPNGSLDTSFGTNGIASVTAGMDFVSGVHIQADGKIISSGSGFEVIGDGRYIAVRVNADGSPDTTFGTNGVARGKVGSQTAQFLAQASILQPDGKLLIVGTVQRSSLHSAIGVVRLNQNGSLDTSFNGGAAIIQQGTTSSNFYSEGAILQSDGKILTVNRYFINANDYGTLLIRLNSNGSLDAGFGSGGGVFRNNKFAGEDMIVQSDGRIIVAGGSYTPYASGEIFLERFNTDGTLDAGFGTGGQIRTTVSGGMVTVNDVVAQADGKIIVTGRIGNKRVSSDCQFDNPYSGQFLLVRYNSNGTVDTTFGNGGGVGTSFGTPDAEARESIVQPDGKIVTVGFIGDVCGLNSDFAVSRYLGGQVGARRTLFDFDGDGRADQAVFRSGVWYLFRSGSGFTSAQFGVSTDKLAPADFDGDGKTDIAVFRDGVWYWLNSSNGNFNGVQFGSPGDVPVPADYTGDGRAELAVYRLGFWYLLNLANNQFQAVQFGISSDKPVPADFDADGKTDVAVFRDGNWYWLRSSDNGFRAAQWGIASDKPVVGDYDGDSRADQAVYRSGVWYILGSTQGFFSVQFGIAGDVPVAADYDGDGKTDVAVFRDGNWYWLDSSNNQFRAMQWGIANDKPIPAAFVP